MEIAGDALHELPQERAHHVGGILGAEDLSASLSAARARPPSGRRFGPVLAAQEVGHEGEGQGMSVGEVQHRRVLRRGHTPRPQVGPALPGQEIRKGR